MLLSLVDCESELIRTQRFQERQLKPRAVHQFHAGSAYGDGVTNGMLFIQRILRQAGYKSEIYCVDVDSRLADRLTSYRKYVDRADQVVLVHYSHGHEHHRWIDEISAAKVLIYHNITPAQFLPEGSRVRQYAELGRQQLKSWGRQHTFIGTIADSPFNARELERLGFSSIATIPLLVDLDHLRNHPWNRELSGKMGKARNLLFLGRWAENKGQLDLVRMMSVLRKLCRMPMRLILAGGVTSPQYFEQVQAEIRNLRLEDSVIVFEQLEDEDVFAMYRAADLYVSLSRHEGFGMPLVEAMAFDVPVLAVAAGAVPSTLGSGGLLLESRDAEFVAGAANIVLQEPWLRREIVRAQRQELERYERRSLVGSLQDYLCRLGLDINLSRATSEPPKTLDWRIEGPFDSSYSLAVVNRELAIALADQGQSVGLICRDGPGLFAPDQAFLAGNPALAAMWDEGQSDCSPNVALRNLYPPIVSDMKGELRGLACYAWEESGFPTEYLHAVNSTLNLISVTSRFVAKVLRDNGVHVPIRVVGDGIDQIVRPEQQGDGKGGPIAQRFSLADNFCFFHMSSCFPRKGVDVLLAAWAKAFTRQDNVVLVIKTIPNEHNSVEDDIAALAGTHPNHARIVFIKENLDIQEIYELYRAADVVVCPSRGEGFCLPLAEALAIGKPVITTAFGGQTDFCNDETSWLCDYRFAYARTHFAVPNSVWVEPQLDSLVECLRASHSATPQERARRGEAGRALVLSRFRWKHVAARLIMAVEDVRALDTRAIRLPKLGWVSTWNSRCGIADYSEALACAMAEERLVVFANRNAIPNGVDPPFLSRCWEQGWNDPLDDLYQAINAADLDAVVIQFNFGFFRLAALARLIDRLTDKGIAVYLFLHSTADVEKPDVTIQLSDVRESLARARRLLVHSVHDLNRLKMAGLVNNVTLFPFGLPEPVAGGRIKDPPRHGLGRRGRLRREVVIASFGFLLPHKGLRELIEAFSILLRDVPNGHLLMLNALYPAEESQNEYEACMSAIQAHWLKTHVTLNTNYLSDREIVAQLGTADLVVYPYQNTQESASAAVRLGLASLAPVACTPLPIFDDVAAITHRLPGLGPIDLAAGIAGLLGDEKELFRLADAQRAWVAAHSWAAVSQRLDGLIRGEFVDDLARHPQTYN
jgi:glycosyltransferase involved in cell wall biosynthesis